MGSKSSRKGCGELTETAKVIYTITVLVGLLLGLPWGIHVTKRSLSVMSSEQRSFVHRELEGFSGVQYENADSDHARSALLMYVNFLKEAEKANPKSISTMSLSIALTRLALLEDKAHNAEQSQVYMDEARLVCKSERGSECSESDMKKIAEAFNERPICKP